MMSIPVLEIKFIITILLATPLLCSVFAIIFSKLPWCMNLFILIASLAAPMMSVYMIDTIMLKNSSFINIVLYDFININIEPIGVIFLNLASFLWVVTNLYSWSYLNMNPEINKTKFYFFLSISIFCTFGIALSGNLIITFVFYELLTLLTFPLVANVGTDHEKRSARKYLSILLFASMALFLPAILFILQIGGKTSFEVGGIINGNLLSNNFILIIFLLTLYGVAKAAIVPVHSWLLAAMAAPIPVSAFLHAVAVVKSGLFIILKVIVYIFGIGKMQKFAGDVYGINIFTILCAASLAFSSIMALYQNTIKKLLAYSTINQLSICLLSASMLNPIAIKASILHMVSHAFGKISLFFVAGYVYSSWRITKISEFAGLGRKYKFVMAIFTIAALSIIGVPIFAGFVSKAYILVAALRDKVNYFVAAMLTFSIVITAHYFIRLIYIIYYAKPEDTEDEIFSQKPGDGISMVSAISITAVGIIAYIFLYSFMLNLMEQIRF